MAKPKFDFHFISYRNRRLFLVLSEDINKRSFMH